MGTASKIVQDMRGAMKARDKDKLGILRMLVASLENEVVSARSAGEVGDKESLSDDVTVSVVQKQVRMLDQELTSLVEAGRCTVAVERQKEAVKKYLPEQLSRDELESYIKDKITELNIGTIKQQGQLMGVLSKELKGKTDMGAVSKAVRNLLKDK